MPYNVKFYFNILDEKETLALILAIQKWWPYLLIEEKVYCVDKPTQPQKLMGVKDNNHNSRKIASS